MDRLTRLARYIGWPGKRRLQEEEEAKRREKQLKDEEEEERRRRQCQCSFGNFAKKFARALESLLLWENTCNSLSALVAFNVIFWGFVLLEVRGLAAAGSAALVLAFCCSTLEIQEEVDQTSRTSQSAEQIEKLIRIVKSSFESLVRLQQEQPRAFCTFLCTVTLTIWVIGRNFESVAITYAICMSILVTPGVLLRCPSKYISSRGWDSEIEEFLPATTEANLQVLKWAGETGRSHTPPSPDMDASQDQFDEDLVGLRMPSHEDGSIDGLELSELELSSGETDVDGIRFKSAHFERGSSSSSDDDVDLGLEAKTKLDVDNDDDSDDSEFEIIDTQELANLKNV